MTGLRSNKRKGEEEGQASDFWARGDGKSKFLISRCRESRLDGGGKLRRGLRERKSKDRPVIMQGN